MSPAFPKRADNIRESSFKVTNTSKNTVLADKAEVADTFLKRLIGLLRRKSLSQGEALILIPSNSIHSFFMRFSIDVLFLDKSGRVVKTIVFLSPWRLTKVYFKAHLTIELPVGTIERTSTQEGDTVSILKN
ncbi:MAG: DUF192 domain-containing protein [Candidatus Omnitrophica bacterium]|nr:DUF192 domain-containing protein [Candidatus Omnitrophota bacterium]